MVAIDGVGFYWSYMAENEVPTNMALMAFSDSERIASVEEQLVFYKKNKVIFCEQIAILKRDISYRDSKIGRLKCELGKLKKEKESTQLKLKIFDHASKSLDKLIGSQITNKSRKGIGLESYNVVLPPPTGLFSPLKIDLSYSGLEVFQQAEFEIYRPKSCKIESKNSSENIPNELKESIEVKESSNVPLVKKPRLVNTARPRPVNTVRPRPFNTVRPRPVNTTRPNPAVVNVVRVQENQGYVDSGCSRHMTGNMSYLLDFNEFNGGYVTFKRGENGDRIIGKGTIYI
nr:putative ribonuclease H-like domain-containing protein [Tanacetum cinerariifolium]